MGSCRVSDGIGRIRQSIYPCLQSLIDRYRQETDDWYRRELEEDYLRIVEDLLRLITSRQQYHFQHLGTTQEDLLQWARVAAVESLKRFDHSRGTDFLAYLISFVRRYVYNRMLDELPVPRIVSKRIRSYTARGVAITALPSALYNAAMLRCPVPVGEEVLELHTDVSAEGWDDPEDDQFKAELRSLVDFIGEERWELLCDCLERLPSGKRRLSSFINQLIKLEVPPELQPLMDNLIDYLRRQVC